MSALGDFLEVFEASIEYISQFDIDICEASLKGAEEGEIPIGKSLPSYLRKFYTAWNNACRCCETQHDITRCKTIKDIFWYSDNW